MEKPKIGEKSKEIMSIVESIKKFIEPVKVANVMKVMSAEM